MNKHHFYAAITGISLIWLWAGWWFYQQLNPWAQTFATSASFWDWIAGAIFGFAVSGWVRYLLSSRHSTIGQTEVVGAKS